MSERERFPGWHGTTIVAVRKGGRVVVAGDGQVSLGQTVIKGTARKVRRLTPGGQPVLCGFAGSTADAFTLLERLEKKLEAAPGQLQRAAVELAKDWRTDKYLRNLEAMLIVTDGAELYVITGAGDVLEPEHDVTAIGSGGNYALAAARALDGQRPRRRGDRPQGHGDRRRHLRLHQRQPRPWRALAEMTDLTPREIVSELDRFIIGQADAKRAVAVALRNRWRRKQLPDDIREEVYPKNILMIGPTGVGKTEISRRLAKLAKAPFLKVEATKFTEVGYVGRDVEQIVRDLVDAAVVMVREDMRERVKARAHEAAENRVIDALAGDGVARPDPRDVPQASSAPASSTTRRSSSRSPTPPAPSR